MTWNFDAQSREDKAQIACRCTTREARFIFQTGRGINVHRGGWPDFIVEVTTAMKNRARDFLAVEIKGPAERVTETQMHMHAILRHAGLPVVVLRDRGYTFESDEGISLHDLLFEKVVV